jgi:hypothetical protein
MERGRRLRSSPCGLRCVQPPYASGTTDRPCRHRSWAALGAVLGHMRDDVGVLTTRGWKVEGGAWKVRSGRVRGTPDGRLFRSEHGGLVDENAYLTIWNLARLHTLTPAQLCTGLAEVPYDLRHARQSIWLAAGVNPAQVAEWAGNSVNDSSG